MKRPALIILAAIVVFSCKKEPRDQQDQFIHIGKKESIRSNVLGEDRPFWVYVPPYTRDSGKKFAVLYLLDGDAHFHSVSGLIQILGTGVNGTYKIPEMIVVAIPNTNRTRDLTPSHSEIMGGRTHEFLKASGGGSNFLKFLQTELIPYIESTYPTHPYRVLVGHSFGGIAAINALYTMPETFDAYVAIDPSIWWDGQLLLKKADSIFKTQKFDNKYFFLGQANTLNPGESTNDHFGSIKEYVKVLESPANISGIRWSYKYYEDDSHASVPFISEYDGLRFIFNDFSPSWEKLGTDPEALRKNYAQYRLPVPEPIVNIYAHAAMDQNNLDLAQLYFQMNVDAYPRSSNAHDSFGEFWLAKGDTVKSVQHYEKSLELDPKNENARNNIRLLLKK